MARSPIGRQSIPPEKLRWAMFLQTFYSIQSERLLMERLEYDLLVPRVGIDDAAWDHSVFSKNRDRLLEGAMGAKFLAAVLSQPRVKKLLSSELLDGRNVDRGLGVDRSAIVARPDTAAMPSASPPCAPCNALHGAGRSGPARPDVRIGYCERVLRHGPSAFESPDARVK
jgi:hypothetical protein